MKKTAIRIAILCLLITLFTGVIYASESEFVIEREVTYQNNKNHTFKDGFIKIMLGQLDFTQYSKDEYLKVTPRPDEIQKDEFGNMYAYYSVAGMLPNEKLCVKIERKMKTSSFVTDEPILARSNGSVTDENRIYIEPQERIESDEKEIIDKSNEITAGLSTDYRKASAIFEFVNTQMVYANDTSNANKGALSALKSMKGVCEEFATLYVALCRAQEIPSRVVAGYKYDASAKTLVDHAWAEIYLDDYGWVPVEPTVIYTVDNKRATYWNSFCMLDNSNYIPTELYYCEEYNRTYYKYLTEGEYVVSFAMDDDIVLPEQNSFADISMHTWAQPSIQSLFEKDIVKGYSDTEYGPNRNISRIEFICMLSRTLKYLNENYVEGANVYYYPSYNRNHWSKPEYDYLMRCYQFYTPSDIMSAGYFNIAEVFGDNINIDKAITRGEVVALMDIFMDDTTVTKSFTDVKSGTKFASSIEKAYSNNLITGYPDGSFRPNATITRAEMATILGRYIDSNMYVVE